LGHGTVLHLLIAIIVRELASNGCALAHACAANGCALDAAMDIWDQVDMGVARPRLH
jgi:hypothetical protein